MSRIPPAGPHGGDGARLAAALGVASSEVLDLSASLNPVAPDPAKVVARHLDAVRRYPDSSEATKALAEAMDVSPDRLLLTNGGAEAIRLVAAELGGRVVEPDFSLLPRNGGPVWRSDPHNPTGRLAPPSAPADVWDEAFYPLATGRWTGSRPATVVGSLTKLFACPGLRIGYVLAPPGEKGPDLLERIRCRQPDWAVNGLALSALPELLARAELARWCGEIAELRRELTRVLERFDLGPLLSDANYVLCDAAAGLRRRLAPAGVLVRDCASFGLEGYARIAVPDEAGLTRLASALERTS